MERWQILYLIIVGAGLGVGWYTSPRVALAFVWICIAISEIMHHRREMREFERRAGGD